MNNQTDYRTVGAAPATAPAMVRWRVAYEAALREAVRAKRPLTWVAGVPALWGDHTVRESLGLWEV